MDAPLEYMGEPDASRPAATVEVASASGPNLPPNPDAVPNPLGRKVIYNADVKLRVDDPEEGRARAEDVAGQCAGFVESSNDSRVKIRVPSNRFKDAMSLLEQIGEVIARDITSKDVTPEYYDIALRIDVGEASRKRLIELLAKSGEIKDVLEVEKEIRRLTEEIEGLKGMLRLMKDQVELATIIVTLEKIEVTPTPTPTSTPTPTPTPLARRLSGSATQWLYGLGLERLMHPVDASAPIEPYDGVLPRIWPRPFQLNVPDGTDLPEGFIPLMRQAHYVLGASSEDYRFSAKYFRLEQPASLDYWRDSTIRYLRDTHGYKLHQEDDFTLESKKWKGVHLASIREFENQSWMYDIWMIQRINAPKKIVIIELGVPKIDAHKYVENIEAAVKGIK